MKMKKYIYQLFIALFAIGFMNSCSEDWGGTLPGNDTSPVATVYKYAPSRPYNSDNDVKIRVAINSKTTEAYYLVEKTANITMDESAYMDHVVSKGTKLTVTPAENSGESIAEFMVTDLYGDHTITVVAVGNGTKTLAKTTFTGLDWETKAEGTYYFATKALSGTAAATILRMASKPTALQICTTNAKLYRLKDLFGVGYSMKITMLDLKGEDEDGEYTFFRIPAMEIPFTHTNNLTLNVRDIGYWQGSDLWITERGYESGMYGDYFCFFLISYYTSAGTHGYGYDFFVPD